jgi:hypothetical protein
MTTSALNKFLSIFSLASIATVVLIAPAIAKPITYRGEKGTYTVDTERHTYRGCLYSGGCISLKKKHWVPCSESQLRAGCQHISWAKGEYTYRVNADPKVIVYKGGEVIFEDVLRE